MASDQTLTLCPAAPSDAADLLAWRNDPVTRANSRNTGVIEPETHAAWLDRVLQDPNRRLWVARRGGAPVGTVSAARDGDAAVEVSVTVTPACRGSGVATAMIRAVLAETAALWPGMPVLAVVRAGNAASRRLFERCGFVATGEEDGFVSYRRAG